MSQMAQPAKQGFRPSMLLSDKRYRGITIQVAVFVLVMAGVWWLFDNLLQNLAAQGKDFSFNFLFTRAGYDIPQTLIPYSSDDTHFRAMIVGLLNTLLVAAIGCITATVIGVLVGVLRLSGNWLIARLMTIYVEIFRNVPLLLWILIIYAVFTEALPSPRDFRGDAPDATMWAWDSLALTNRYTSVPSLSLGRDPGELYLGFGISLNWAVILMIVCFVAAVALRRTLIRWASQKQEATGIRPATWYISAALFVIPPILLIWFFDVSLIRPELRGFNFSGGSNLPNAFVALWLALSLYTAAFIAEIVRAGILSVSTGQSEAAFALGLSPRRTMGQVVLPQALRVIVPPLISQYLNLTKNSSLAIAVGYMDIRGTLGGTTLNQTGRELEAMALLMGIYLVISLIISSVMNVFNARLRLKER